LNDGRVGPHAQGVAHRLSPSCNHSVVHPGNLFHDPIRSGMTLPVGGIQKSEG